MLKSIPFSVAFLKLAKRHKIFLIAFDRQHAMKNDPFFDLLQTMDKDQFNRFEKYVRIYINKDHQAIRLFDHYCVLRGTVEKKGELLDREKLLDRFTTKEKLEVTRKHLLNLISMIHEVLKKFLASERLAQENSMYDYLLGRIYLDHGLHQHWDAHFKKSSTQLNKLTPNLDAHLDLSRLFYLRYYSLGLEQNERDDKNALESMRHLDEYYLSHKLKWATELLSREKIIGNEYQIRFLPELIQAIEQSPKGAFSAYQLMYKYALALLMESKEEDYLALKETLYQQWPKLSVDEVANILNLLSNYNASQIRSGVDRIDEAYEICKKTIEFKCLQQMNANFLLNSINLCTDKDDPQSATLFFELLGQKYADQKEAILISSAKIALSKGEYQKALDLLPDNQQFPLPSLGIRARLLKVQAIYELDEIELLEGHLRSFKEYCKREKKAPSLNAETLEGVTQFIQFLGDLIKLAPFDKNGHKKLYSNVLDSKKISAKRWLVQKISARGKLNR